MAVAPEPPDWPRLADLLLRSVEGLSFNALNDLRDLLNEGRAIVDCTEAGLLVPGRSSNELRFLVSVNSSPEVEAKVLGQVIPCDRSLAGCVLLTGQLIARTNPAALDPDQFYHKIDSITGLRTDHYLAVPVTDDGQTLGVATFVNRPAARAAEPFSAPEIARSRGIARLLAVGLRHYLHIAHQLEWIQVERERALSELLSEAGDPSLSPLRMGSPLKPSRPPLFRALVQLEGLPAEHQELAADLIGCIAGHSPSWRPAGPSPDRGSS